MPYRSACLPSDNMNLMAEPSRQDTPFTEESKRSISDLMRKPQPDAFAHSPSLRRAWTRLQAALEIAGPAILENGSGSTGATRIARDATVVEAFLVFLERAQRIKRSDEERFAELSESLVVAVQECFGAANFRPHPSLDGAKGDVAQVAENYGNEARGWKRSARYTQIAVGLSGFICLSSLVWGILYLHHDVTRPVFPTFLPYLALAVTAAIASLLLQRKANEYERLAAESRRLQAQVGFLDPFLAGMDPRITNILRAALAPRLFPRILADDDPLREPIWPSTAELIEALDGESGQLSGAE